MTAEGIGSPISAKNLRGFRSILVLLAWSWLLSGTAVCERCSLLRQPYRFKTFANGRENIKNEQTNCIVDSWCPAQTCSASSRCGITSEISNGSCQEMRFVGCVVTNTYIGWGFGSGEICTASFVRLLVRLVSDPALMPATQTVCTKQCCQACCRISAGETIADPSAIGEHGLSIKVPEALVSKLSPDLLSGEQEASGLSLRKLSKPIVFAPAEYRQFSPNGLNP
jgi:hypothetical protein